MNWEERSGLSILFLPPRPTCQRYWVNAQHWASPRGPVFLHLGGEGSLTSGSVMRGEKPG